MQTGTFNRRPAKAARWGRIRIESKHSHFFSF
jgi:hypothetical protein